MRALRLVLGLAIAGVFVWLTFRGVDTGAVLTAAVRMDPLALAGAVLALGFAYALRVVRWEIMLRVYRPGLTPAAAAAPLLIGFAANNLLPFRLGDLVRVFAFARRLRIGPAALASSLVVERLLDLVSLLALALVGAVLLGAHGGALVSGLATIAAAGVLGAVAVMIAAGPLAGVLIRAARLGQLRRIRIARRSLAFAARAAHSIAILRPQLPWLAVLSMLAWLSEGLVFWFVAWGMAAPHDLRAWFALALGNLGTLLPGAPGHVGTFHFFTKQGLVSFGTAPDLAAAQAIVTHAVIWLTVTLAGGGAYLLVWRRRSGGR